jgi:hypothetical protein
VTDVSTLGRGRQPLRAGGRFRVPQVVEHLPLVLLVLGVLGQGIWLIHLVRTSWFGTDDFNFLTTRGPVPGHDLGLWRPYAGHWSTVPVLLYRALFAVFGMHSYLPYVAVVVAVHLAEVLVMYALLRSVGARPWLAAGTGWLLLWYGAGAEAFMVAAAMNHTVPMLLALIACLVVVRTDGSERGLRIAMVLGVVTVMCSATGLTMLGLLGGLVALRHGVRSAARVVAPSLVALTVWLLLYGRHGGRGSIGLDDLRLVPSFLWEGLTSAGGVGLGVGRTGGLVLCVALVLVVVQHLGPSALRELAVVGAAVAAMQLVLVTLGDAPLGSGIASSGRYLYVVLFLLAPGIALVAQVCVDHARDRIDQRRLEPGGRLVPVVIVVTLAALLAAYTWKGVSGERHQAAINEGSAGVYRTWAYGSLAAVDAGERQLSFQWGFLGAPFELLASPHLRSRMPPPPHRDTRLDAEAMWFVQVGTDDAGMFSPTRISVHGLTGAGARRAGCHDLTTDGSGPATIDVPTGSGTEIGLTGNSTQVTTQLFRRYAPSLTRTWSVAPGPVYVATSAKDAILRVVLNGSGTMTLCHQ